MTEQELEFWKQVYAAFVASGSVGGSWQAGKCADEAVNQLRERQKHVIKPIEPML